MRKMRLLALLILASLGITGLYASPAAAGEPGDPVAEQRSFLIPRGNGTVEKVVATKTPQSSSQFSAQTDSEFKVLGAPAPTPSPYQTDLVSPSDITATDPVITGVELNVKTSTRGCSDPDSCANGQRKTGGYTWFQALTVEVGANADQNLAGLHAGIALGGSGQSAQWYFDWSGYYGDFGWLSGASLGPPKGQNIKLIENRTYRIRIERVGCGTGVNRYGWNASIRDSVTGVSSNAGTFCVGFSNRIAETYYFTEIIESNPCFTDFAQGLAYGLTYYDVAGKPTTPASAQGVYIDNTCSDTNLRTVWYGIPITLDDRQMTRGTGGGITESWQQLW